MQIKEYNEKGYLAPIDILSLNEVREIKQEIEKIEKKWPSELMNKKDIILRNNANI